MRVKMTLSALLLAMSLQATNPPVYIAFLWHMHQPIYWPYESVVQTDANNRYSFSVTDIHNQRLGPYNSWPKDAVGKGLSFAHLGAQVSFSGSLMENLDNLKNAGNGNFSNWTSAWNTARTWTTSLGNPRMDLVGFGYHHPLMGLIPYTDIRKQIQAHKTIFSLHFSGNYSKGIFPPENAFTERMIPALKDEGFDWVLVDNLHFDRACNNYPFSTSGNVYEMNRSDQQNADPGNWVQLNNLWAPTRNSARWGRQPHFVQYTDPASGQTQKIIAVPCDRYMGNEDGRGGFGALSYESVMSQLEAYNTDAQHPILIMLHHDGDNYGGGTDSYYGSNFQNFVNWLQTNSSRFVCTTVQDYLQQFPPDANDVIHVEDGSWSGADNGDPEFKKWNGDPSGGYSPDRNSWGVITAAQNFVHTAEQQNPGNVHTVNAWKYLMNGEASDYWYWDGSSGGIWDAHPTRAANMAIAEAAQVSGADATPPTIYPPQREPYNPGGTEWNQAQPNTFNVWSYVYDKSGLKSVKLKWRTDLDDTNPIASTQNETYAGGSEVSAWKEVLMQAQYISPQTTVAPNFKAREYTAAISGLGDTLVDYYIEATDSNNNVASSPIMHVWVGGAAVVVPDSNQFAMDGALDPKAQLIAASGDVHLWAAYNGTDLYVATEAAPSQGGDKFVFVSKTRNALTAFPWAKTGSVGQWDAYLANESTNNYATWTDCVTNLQKSAAYVEGKFNVVNEFGSTPDTAYIVAVKMQTANQGTLMGQAPAGDGNGNVESVEWAAFPLRFVQDTTVISGIGAVFEEVRVTPVPSQGGVKIQGVFAEKVKVWNTGALVMEIDYPAGGMLDLSGLADGVYQLEIAAAEKTFQRRVVKIGR
ncbi:MAG: hypothetical protein U0T84_04675 [Chitinophagales bacterium]